MVLNGFIDTIKALGNLPMDEIEKLLAISKLKTIQKGELFIRAGDIPKQLGFNLKGLFRYFYTDNDWNDFVILG